MEKTELIEEGERILGCVKQVPGFGLFGNTKFPENALDEDNYRALFIYLFGKNKYVHIYQKTD